MVSRQVRHAVVTAAQSRGREGNGAIAVTVILHTDVGYTAVISKSKGRHFMLMRSLTTESSFRQSGMESLSIGFIAVFWVEAVHVITECLSG